MFNAIENSTDSIINSKVGSFIFVDIKLIHPQAQKEIQYNVTMFWINKMLRKEKYTTVRIQIFRIARLFFR
jgi:hypothetical protein